MKTLNEIRKYLIEIYELLETVTNPEHIKELEAQEKKYTALYFELENK